MSLLTHGSHLPWPQPAPPATLEPAPEGPALLARNTPDKLVERITKRKAGVLFTSGPLSNANWAAALTANKARKTAITNPARKRMVSWLEAKAERSEKMAIDSMIEHILESPPIERAPLPRRLKRLLWLCR